MSLVVFDPVFGPGGDRDIADFGLVAEALPVLGIQPAENLERGGAVAGRGPAGDCTVHLDRAGASVERYSRMRTLIIAATVSKVAMRSLVSGLWM